MSEPSGILAYVYRDALGDCTNGGISAKHDRMILVLPEGGPFKVSAYKGKDIPIVYLAERLETSERIGRDCAAVVEFGKHVGDYCAGGNFLWVSDIRFPRNHPIPIFDRAI